MSSLISKRQWAFFVGLGLVVALLALLVSRDGDATRPRFVAADSQRNYSSLGFVQYNFLQPRPFEGGKTWIGARGNDGYHILLFDIDKRAVLGELLHADPAFMNADRSKVVCSQRTRDNFSLEAFVSHLTRLFGGRAPQTFDEETFWLVDLKGSSAVRLGTIRQSAGSGSTLFPAPGFERAYVKSTASLAESGFSVCDLTKKTLRDLQLDGTPAGWWDNDTLVLKDVNCDFVLYNVVRQKTSPFLSQSQIARAFKEAEIIDDPVRANLFFVWNGRENDVFLTDTHKRWEAKASYLFKVQRPTGELKLMSRDFKFEWSDSFNPAQTLYLYSGRDAGQGSSAVYLRDLASHSETALIPDDGAKRMSIPQFYGDGAIFTRDNALWHVDLKGSNVTRLFPPQNGN